MITRITGNVYMYTVYLSYVFVSLSCFLQLSIPPYLQKSTSIFLSLSYIPFSFLPYPLLSSLVLLPIGKISPYCLWSFIFLFICTLGFSYKRNNATFKLVCLIYNIWFQGAYIYLNITQHHPSLLQSSTQLYILSHFIYSSVDGHLGCSHDKAVITCAAINISMHVSL